MSRSTAIRCGLLATALAVLATPASAATASLPLLPSLPSWAPPQVRALVKGPTTARSHHRTAFRPELSLAPRNGYEVHVVGIGSSAAVVVERRHDDAQAAYIARGTVTTGRIEASFGSLGRVAMRFRPSRNQPRPKPHRTCHGKGRFTVRRGVYVGTFRFTGEDRYITVDAHRAKGTVKSLAPQCARKRFPRPERHATHPPSPLRLGVSLLSAGWRDAVDAAEFAALGGLGRANFLALTEQSDGGLAILRVASAPGSADSFALDDALTHARVSPPPPFDGAATYRAAPDGTRTWTGSLSADFPGAEDFPLAGPPFTPSAVTSF
jgi:hypothetical protein